MQIKEEKKFVNRFFFQILLNVFLIKILRIFFNFFQVDENKFKIKIEWWECIYIYMYVWQIEIEFRIENWFEKCRWNYARLWMKFNKNLFSAKTTKFMRDQSKSIWVYMNEIMMRLWWEHIFSSSVGWLIGSCGIKGLCMSMEGGFAKHFQCVFYCLPFFVSMCVCYI